MLGLVIIQNSSTMVYCKTETNLCPPGPEMWECPTNKGSAAALPRYSSAVCPTGVRCTSAVDMWSWAPPPFDMWVLAFMTGGFFVHSIAIEDGRYKGIGI